MIDETVEEHRFNRTLAEAARNVEDGGADAAANGGLLREEAQGVDDILAKRGLLGGADDDDDDDSEDLGDRNKIGDAIDGACGDNEQGERDGALNETVEEVASDSENNSQSGRRTTPGSGAKDDINGKGVSEADGRVTEGSKGGVSGTAFDEFNFGGNPGTVNDGKGAEKQNDLLGDAENTPAEKKDASSRNVLSASISDGRANAPSSSNLGAAFKNIGGGGTNAPGIADGTSLKELRKLRRHVLQLNSDLESAEREILAQRQELDRAASRMERDRSRHKQEREAADASHKTEILALESSHERAMRQLKESNDAALREMEGRVARTEQQRAKEGGERDADLADALERERMAVATTARLQEEMMTLNERITSLTNETLRLETRLEHATSQMELASERERNAEEQLDKALSLHARQLGMRQRRESELEQTVADLAAALVVAKNKVEASMMTDTILDGGETDAKEDPLDLKARLQDSQDEIETLRAQVSLERRRCSTLHEELQAMSKEQNDELSGAHAKQRQYERKISDLTTMIAKLQSSLRRAASSDMGNDDIDGTTAEEFTSSSDVQYSGDEKKETDHLRKQISSLSEKILEQQSRIDHGRGEISTLKNRLRSALLRAETTEKSLQVANQRLITLDFPMSEMSSADEELGLRTRPPFGTKPRGGFQRISKVESIRSALGLHPGRFPSGSWHEMIASLLDTFDVLSVDLGSHFRHYPVSRLAFMMYLLILHMWAFFLLVYHAHAQGTGSVHGPEAMMSSSHYEQAVQKVATAANFTSP
ncbi:hypothetical protein ACHAXA_000044 [Cyclostephanos tholiformis]|uniref:Golgin-84 n=1 Tax=Cyclostephanos tholiformis TaxID=382380 RepID=A0ABD3SRB9_9STRA